MTHSGRRNRFLAVAVPLVLLGINSWFLHTSVNQLFLASQWVRQSLEVRETLIGIKADLLSAETGQRGYLLTSEQLYLAPYHQAEVELRQKMRALDQTLAQTEDYRRRFREMNRLVDQKLDELASTIQVHGEQGSDASNALVAQNRGKFMMDRLRLLIGELQQLENQELREREARYEAARIVAFISFAVLMAAVVGLFATIWWSTRRAVLNKHEAAKQIESYANSLNDTVSRLTVERSEITLLNEAGSFLQSCNTMSEVADLAGPFMQRLFPALSGGLYIYAASRNQLTVLVQWGEGTPDEVIDPQECWALRRGMVHHHEQAGSAPSCRHHHDARDTLCLPLLAHGEAIGLLALKVPENGNQIAPETIRLANMLVHQLGLTLSNIRLRETLNEQSIRDPLTNAFNRRYLDMVAEKEIAQARRLGQNVAIAMLDIDHFKRFNDLNGHLAGDVALSSVVDHLQENLRSGDWLFRYGGEEFLVMMRGVSPENAQSRFERIIASVSELQLSHEERALPKVTISVGMAMFPENGFDFTDLVALADDALYRAKKEGRNRLCVAERTESLMLLTA
ncbi:diguanylate cyclase [Georhizobium profundi]|uniref:diguanylate cyclase n=1 Tax=Georhizobium profundi TaxID=2341112 RepID=A0A3S9B2U6_9HYPH|nr:diguanylate cyclase [Georhizobium profundi]